MDTLERAAQRFALALEQHQTGNLSQAETLYREALALAPERVSVLVNLAAVLTAQGRFVEALRYCKRVLKLEPTQHNALQNAAVCRYELYRDPESLALMETAKQLASLDFDGLVEHGVAASRHGRLDEALGCFDRALVLRPDSIEMLLERGGVLARLRRAKAALSDLAAVLRIDPASTPAQQAVYELFRTGASLALDADAEIESLAIRAMVEPWGRPQGIAPFLIAMLRRHAEIGALLERFDPRADETPTLAAREWQMLDASALLPVLLQNCRIPDAALERMLTELRRALLQQALRADGGGDETAARLALHCALARQCFLNDYLYPTSADELKAAATLRARVGRALRDTATDVPPSWLAACASYAPLGIGLDGARLLGSAWPEPVAQLLRQQLREPAQEHGLAAGIGSLTAIEDPGAQRQRRQQQALAYPRWVALPARREPQSLAAYLDARVAGIASHEIPRSERVMVLSAGCATGQRPIEIARDLGTSEVLAIDLSRTRLAYAKRMALQMGRGNLRFAQADILALGNCGLRFDLIECSGVLQRLAEPQRGLAILLGLLRDHGLMRLGLYSASARQTLAAVRARAAAPGFESDSQGLRVWRRLVQRMPPQAAEHGVISLHAFHALGECRDLLLQRHADRVDLAFVAAALERHRLQLLGFELDAPRRAAFDAMFPDPAARRDLAAWERFESSSTDRFVGMEHFWVRWIG